MSKCDNCGRDDGHWLGCAKAHRLSDPVEQVRTFVEKTLDNLELLCTHGDCKKPRRSADKRVKFCETHSDPKNRK